MAPFGVLFGTNHYGHREKKACNAASNENPEGEYCCEGNNLLKHDFILVILKSTTMILIDMKQISIVMN